MTFTRRKKHSRFCTRQDNTLRWRHATLQHEGCFFWGTSQAWRFSIVTKRKNVLL